MTIRIWNAFSSNNSSSCRLVARFVDPRVARETAAELATFLIEHIGEIRRRWIDSQAAAALATRYGFEWKDLLEWSTHFRPGDEPEIATEGHVVVVYHHYCLGFGDITQFLEAKGATLEPELHGTGPMLSALFCSRLGDNEELDRELDELVAHIDDNSTCRVPWSLQDQPLGRAAYFRDAGSVGLYLRLAPQSLPSFEHWLARHGIERPSIRWCEDGDEALFRAIAKARCAACTGLLEYLDPRIHDIESPQLVCRPCGGLYELSTFLSAVP